MPDPRDLIQQDDLDGAAEALLSLVRGLEAAGTLRGQVSRALNLSARVARLRRDLADSLLTREQAQVDRSQIRFAFLAVLDDIDKATAAQPRGSSTAAQSHDPPIDFAILTAIEVERRAVCAAFSVGDEHRIPRGSRVYWRGRFKPISGQFYEIVVAQSADMANVDAALLASDMLHHWNPGAALLVGIAASANKDVRCGDVVVGSDIYYYARGKETPEGIKREPKMIPADPVLWSNVAALPDWNGSVPVKRPDGTSNQPRIHRGVIASGERVIADVAARDRIAAEHRKILAIAMEDYGFSRAVWQSGDQVRQLVLRGICDDGSPAKDDRWHPYAAAAVARFTVHFLSHCQIEPSSWK